MPPPHVFDDRPRAASSPTTLKDPRATSAVVNEVVRLSKDDILVRVGLPIEEMVQKGSFVRYALHLANGSVHATESLVPAKHHQARMPGYKFDDPDPWDLACFENEEAMHKRDGTYQTSTNRRDKRLIDVACARIDEKCNLTPKKKARNNASTVEKKRPYAPNVVAKRRRLKHPLPPKKRLLVMGDVLFTAIISAPPAIDENVAAGILMHMQ